MKCDGVGEPRGCCRGRWGFPAPLGGGVRDAPGVCGRGWPELRVLRPHLQPPAASAPVRVRLGRPGGRHVGRDRGHRGECGDTMGGCVTCCWGQCREGDDQCKRLRGGRLTFHAPKPDHAPDLASRRALCVPFVLCPQAGGWDPTWPCVVLPPVPVTDTLSTHSCHTMAPLGPLPEPCSDHGAGGLSRASSPRRNLTLPDSHLLYFLPTHAPSSFSGDWPQHMRRAPSVTPAGHAEFP